MQFPDVTTIDRCAALFPTSVDGVKTLAENAKSSALAALEAVYTAPKSWANVISAGDNAQAAFSVNQNILGVVKETSPHAEIREAAVEKYVELEGFLIENFACNRRLYHTFLDYVKECPHEFSENAEKKYYISETLKNFKRMGLDLPDEQFFQVVMMNKRVSELGSQFNKNIADDSSSILATAEELEGVPADNLATFKKDGDKFILGVDYPTYFAVQKTCVVPTTRERLAIAFENRAHPQNLPIIHELIHTRHVMAQIIGYPSYAHWDLDSKMVKTPDAARSFITEAIPPLQKKWEKELQALKSDLPKGLSLTPEGNFKLCDMQYAIHQYKTKHLNVDENLIKEYFPLESTTEGLFSIYESFFDITFSRVGATFWAPEVFAMSVTCKQRKTLLGHIILDLFPREGKFSHACCCAVVPSISKSDSPALAVVLANFPTPSADRPALFLHDDVETFFHEFGHAIHMLMGRCEMTSMAGYNVKTDFVEMPSQILEEWLWEKEILQKITKHYKTNEPLPTDLIEAKIKARNFFSGRDNLRQLTFASLSLELYEAPFASKEPDAMNSDEVINRIQSAVVPGVERLKDTHFQCSFGHLEGYGAAYYSYLYSEVFATDVFHYIKERNGLLSSTLGRQYVQKIIGRGGSVDPQQLLVEFLGRDPTMTAFWSKLGVSE